MEQHPARVRLAMRAVRPFYSLERSITCVWHEHISAGGSFCICTRNSLAYVQVIFFAYTLTVGVLWG